MKFKAINAALIAAIATIITSCDDNGSIGSSLVQTENEIIVDSDFTLSGRSVTNEKVQSRTVTQLLGSLDAIGYGSFSSDFVTQFMPAVTLDTTLHSAADIDSVKLLMMYSDGSFVGDSVVPMGLEVYRLTQQLKAPIFSDFNPADYYDPSAPLGYTIYGASDKELSDSLKKLSYKEIYVDLPLDLGVELYNLYKADPAAYLSPAQFADHFPGLYVKNSYGSGRVTRIQATLLQLYYHWDTVNDAGRDTTYNYTGNFYQATPEVISNNNIDYRISPDLQKRIDSGEAIIAAPAGLDVEFRFPLPEVISRYRQGSAKLTVLNDLSLSIPAEKIANEYGINPPNQLLMVLKSKKQQFFENSEITDGVTSFYATYSISTGCYNFSSLRSYLVDALSRENELTADDYTFVLTPVVVQTEQSASYYETNDYVNQIVPYIEKPAMVKLALDKADIVLTYTNQTVK